MFRSVISSFKIPRVPIFIRINQIFTYVSPFSKFEFCLQTWGSANPKTSSTKFHPNKFFYILIRRFELLNIVFKFEFSDPKKILRTEFHNILDKRRWRGIFFATKGYFRAAIFGFWLQIQVQGSKKFSRKLGISIRMKKKAKKKVRTITSMPRWACLDSDERVKGMRVKISNSQIWEWLTIRI